MERYTSGRQLFQGTAKTEENAFMANSKYTAEERYMIGKEIYDQKFTKYTAAAKYGISPYTARDYLRM